MDIKISDRLQQVKPSATLAISAKAKQMRSEGKEVINFSAGEPDFDTPEYIKEAGIEAIKSGQTKYTPASGTIDLKNAVVEKYKREYSLDYNNKQVVISCGAKHSLYNLFQAIINPGDKVILPAPYWLTYIEQIRIAGGIPEVIDTTANNFKLTVDDMKSAVSSGPIALVLNSPSNPTGAVYSKDELEQIVNIAVDNNVLIISDEIYEAYLYDGLNHVSPAAISDRAKENTVIINGISKTFSMTGWRIGYTIGSEEIISAISKLQSHSTSNPASISQAASIAAVNELKQELKVKLDTFEGRRDLMVNELKDIDHVEINKPQGSFYCFPLLKGYIGKEFNGKKIENSFDIVDYLLENAGVAAVPGKVFGAENYIRLSFATDEESIKKGLNKIKEALGKLIS